MLIKWNSELCRKLNSPVCALWYPGYLWIQLASSVSPPAKPPVGGKEAGRHLIKGFITDLTRAPVLTLSDTSGHRRIDHQAAIITIIVKYLPSAMICTATLPP